MANEFEHITTGVDLSQAEYEGTLAHKFDGQATGDIMYASSAVQLSRLGITASRILVSSVGGLPEWNNILPAFTMAGDLNLGGQSLIGATDSILFIRGKRQAANSNSLWIYTPDVGPGYADLLRMSIRGGIAIAEVSWTNVTHTGLVLSGALDVAGQYLTFLERAAPGAGAANEVRMYAVVGGDTLTDLAAVFQDGTVDIFAQEATDPASPIFEYPDNTELKTIMRKPDRKTIQFVAQFPNGKEFVMREIQYPNSRWN